MCGQQTAKAFQSAFIVWYCEGYGIGITLGMTSGGLQTQNSGFTWRIQGEENFDKRVTIYLF